MALEEWKDFVGNSATFFTILQFLMGIQVPRTTSKDNMENPKIYLGVFWFSPEKDDRGVLLSDFHHRRCDDVCLVQLRPSGGRL